jgi:hypothetical protein
MRIRNAILFVALPALVAASSSVFAQSVKDIKVLKGSCTSASHTAEGQVGTDLTKRQSRYFCDTVVIGTFNDSKAHLLIQFLQKGSQHGEIRGFGGLLGDDNILRVKNLYLEKGMPPVSASDGYCKFFERKAELGSMMCAAMVDEQGRRTVAIVAFDVNRNTRVRAPTGENEQMQSSQLDCKKTVDLHGYLSRAQFQCGFSKYSQKLLDAASACKSHLSDDEIRKTLLHGMKDFDADERKLGSYPMCKGILQKFGQFVAE